MNTRVVSVDPEIQGGTPCFPGTRVPIISLFDHIEGGYTIDYFVSEFPSVRKEQAIALLEAAKELVEQLAALPRQQ
jgi:uncharacterized protein (DUF433 family)